MKNFLGLGITFNAIDDGFSKSLLGITGKVDDTRKSLLGLGNAANGPGGKGVFHKFNQGLQTLGIGKIVSEMGKLRSSLSQVGDAGSGLNNVAVEFDFLRTKMEASLSALEASSFQSQMLGLYRATGLAADEATALADGLGSLNDADIRAILPTVGTLVGKLGMGAGEVAGMFNQGLKKLEATGDEMTSLTHQVFKLQKQYRLTNLMEDLPGIVDNVTKNSLKFGRVNTQQAIRSTIEIAKMAAAFRKVGLSQDEAKTQAMGLNDLFTDMAVSLDKARLGFGMSEELGKMQQALGRVSGKAAGEFTQMIADGADPAQITKYIQSVYKGLEFNPDQQKTLRYGIEQAFGVDVANSLTTFGTRMNAASKAAEKAGEKMKPPTAEFAEFDKKLSGTLRVVERQTKAAEEMVAIVNQLTNKGRYLDALFKMQEGFDKLAQIASKPDSFLGKVMTTLMMIADVGPLAAFGLGQFTSYAKVLGSLIGPILQLSGAFSILSLALKPLGGAGTILKGLTSKAGKLPGAGIVKNAFGFFFGTPAKAAKSMTGGLKQTFSALAGPVARFGSKVLGRGMVALTGPVGIVLGLGWGLYEATSALINNWDSLTGWVGKFSKDGAAGMKKFGEGVSEVWGVLKEGGAMVWASMKTMWTESGIGSEISNYWTALKDSIKDGADEVATYLGKVWEHVGVTFDPLKDGLRDIMGLVKSLFREIGEEISKEVAALLAKYPMLNRLASGLAKAGGGVVDMGKAAVSYFFGDETQPAQPQGAQVIDGTAKFNEAREAVDAARSSPSHKLGDEVAATAIASRTQKGAASFASMAGVDLAPTTVTKDYQNRDMQRLAEEIAALRNDMVKLLSAAGDKKVVVELVGDMRKFLQAVQAEGRKNSSASMAHQAIGG